MGCGGSKSETANQSTQNGTKKDNAGTSKNENIQEGKATSTQDVKETAAGIYVQQYCKNLLLYCIMLFCHPSLENSFILQKYTLYCTSIT